MNHKTSINFRVYYEFFFPFFGVDIIRGIQFIFSKLHYNFIFKQLFIIFSFVQKISIVFSNTRWNIQFDSSQQQ